MDKRLIIILVQIVIVFILVTIITLFIRIDNAFKLEKRISKYSVRCNDSDNISLIDKLWNKYIKFVKGKRKFVKKLVPKLINQYEKYSLGSEYLAEDFIIHKFIIALFLVILTIVAKSIQGKLFTLLQILISFLIGFYLLDIYLIVKNRINRKRIKNDILRAIIIMNNAFKSGHTTIQAVEIASKKLDGPIGNEFRRIYYEMKYGLAPEVVFERFSQRVNLEEAEYLSSSLTILSKIGGNIVAVFDSVEKTLFANKKLTEELKNSTLVSKLVIKILFIVPILNILIIYFLNPGYFSPFFNSPLGIILVIIIVLMFILFIYILRKIASVDEL